MQGSRLRRNPNPCASTLLVLFQKLGLALVRRSAASFPAAMTTATTLVLSLLTVALRFLLLAATVFVLANEVCTLIGGLRLGPATMNRSATQMLTSHFSSLAFAGLGVGTLGCCRACRQGKQR
ncbi:MAG: hypothetical protein ACI9F9_001121 [Candidatus Paceibacteria bacterium]|jgi:hypothetical protein